MNKNISPYFCVAPWTHTYLSPQGERRLCCASREKADYIKQYLDLENADENSVFNPKSLEEHWNSEYMKDIRKRIMNGESISQCQVCNEQILNINTYKDYFTKSLFPHKINEIFEKTDENGYTKMRPISYDYRISNSCNFKCRMCGDLLSSQWETERKAMGVDEKIEPFYSKINQIKFKNFQDEVAQKELWQSVYDGTIEEIYWVGGEPLMWDIHWDVMKYLVDSGQAKNVTIRYNTNLSRIEYKGQNLYDLLPYFKNIQICASIDGTGDIVEYIRHGIKWDMWLENFKKGIFLNKIYGDYGITFDLTITSPGLFSIKNLFDLANELNVNTLIKTTFAFDSSIVMSPLMIPRFILEPILDDILDYVNKQLTPQNKIYYDAIIDLKNKKTFEEQFDDYLKGIKLGKARLENIDKFRNNTGKIENIFSQNKTLIEWWNKI